MKNDHNHVWKRFIHKRWNCLIGAMLSVFAVLASPGARAEVTMPSVLADHMVLQRDRPVHVWGKGDPGEQVRVSFRGHQATSTADTLGRWSIYLPPGDAGGPFSLAIQGKNRIEFTDVMVGDLWLASGQSNMEFPMEKNPPWTNGVQNAQKEVAAANYPNLHLFTVKQNTSDYPLEDVAAKMTWTACTPNSVSGFSAVAYFFGRDLLQKEKVPIGLIESNVGGTPAEAWTSLDALTSDPSLMPVFAARASMMQTQATISLQQKREAVEIEQAKGQGRTPIEPPWRPDPATWAPAALFNAMIAPLTSLPLRGVIWYQGESNTDRERAPVYAQLFKTMIQDWRTHWSQGNFPFLFVQIANFNSTDEWPEVREAQRKTLALANTGMAVSIDIGDPSKIHPTDKQDVGNRLALWARVLSYGEQIEHGLKENGPEFFIDLPKNGVIQADDLQPQKNTFVSVEDLAAATQVVSLVDRWKKPFIIRSAADVTMADLRNTPTVLIGGFNNPWGLKLTEDLPFSMRNGTSIVDNAHSGRSWSVVTGPEGNLTEDYALISRLLHSDTGGPVIVLGGIGSFGTQAAAEFVSSPDKVEAMLRFAPSGWEGKNMQAVLRIKVIGFQPVAVDVIATSYW